MAKSLTPNHLKAVHDYVRHGNKHKAARDNGFLATSADKLFRHPLMKAEIEAVKEEIRADSIYGVKEAMDDAQMALEFARETKNATALVKAVEHKSKLNGLLIERHDVRSVGLFSLNIIGLEGKALVSTGGPGTDPALAENKKALMPPPEPVLEAEIVKEEPSIFDEPLETPIYDDDDFDGDVFK